jgi:hypothetical protein
VYDPAFDPASMPLKQRIGQISGLMIGESPLDLVRASMVSPSAICASLTGAADDQRSMYFSLSCLWMEQMVIAGRAHNGRAWRIVRHGESSPKDGLRESHICSR